MTWTIKSFIDKTSQRIFKFKSQLVKVLRRVRNDQKLMVLAFLIFFVLFSLLILTASYLLSRAHRTSTSFVTQQNSFVLPTTNTTITITPKPKLSLVPTNTPKAQTSPISVVTATGVPQTTGGPTNTPVNSPTPTKTSPTATLSPTVTPLPTNTPTPFVHSGDLTVSQIQPFTFRQGDQVIITGTNFGENHLPSDRFVIFNCNNNVPKPSGNITEWTDTKIVFTVPEKPYDCHWSLGCGYFNHQTNLYNICRLPNELIQEPKWFDWAN